MKIRDNLKLRKVKNCFFVVNPGNGQIDLTDIYTLNEEAAFLWQSFYGQSFTAEMMAEKLCTVYDVGEEQALKDVEAMLEQWKDFEIIVD